MAKVRRAKALSLGTSAGDALARLLVPAVSAEQIVVSVAEQVGEQIIPRKNNRCPVPVNFVA